MKRKRLEQNVGEVVGNIESLIENTGLPDQYVANEVRLMLMRLAEKIKRELMREESK